MVVGNIGKGDGNYLLMGMVFFLGLLNCLDGEIFREY